MQTPAFPPKRAGTGAYQLSHDDVLELPGIVQINVFWKQALPPVVQRSPVGVGADQPAEIGILDRQDAIVIEFVRVDDSPARILHGPDHAGEYR